MSFEIDKALVSAYRSNIQIKFQQTRSRLRDAVLNETQNAEFEFYDRIGPVEAVEVLTRHGDTPLIPTPHDRRRVALRDFDWADLIDKKDKMRMLADPTSAYTINAVNALNRKMDDVVIEAFIATAYTGKTGSTTVAFGAGTAPGFVTSEVAVDYVESGAATDSNMTPAKLRRVRYLLDKSEAANEGEADLYLAIDPSQIQAMLQTPELTSADYNTIKALVQGEIDTWMGFKFIKTNKLPKDANNVRSCYAWEKHGMLLAMGSEIMVDVARRADKRNSVQVYVCGSFGATRMWEEKVIRVKCDEDL